MCDLEDAVRAVVQDFIRRDVLFTALDVSNEVKKSLPLERHRNVRDKVRQLFTSDIESANWARTPILVTLADGTTADALLYHPLADSWDLDNKYSAQQRAQTAMRPTVAQATVPAPVAPAPVSAPVTATVTVSAPVTFTAAKNMWDNLFSTQPSLFPTK